MVDSQRGAYRRVGYNHLIPKKRVWNNNYCFIKNAHKILRILPTLFVKTTDFQLVFNFEQTHTNTIIIWRAWYNGLYTMMAKPIRAQELCPMIQFVIRAVILHSSLYYDS